MMELAIIQGALALAVWLGAIYLLLTGWVIGVTTMWDVDQAYIEYEDDYVQKNNEA